MLRVTFLVADFSQSSYISAILEFMHPCTDHCISWCYMCCQS